MLQETVDPAAKLSPHVLLLQSVQWATVMITMRGATSVPVAALGPAVPRRVEKEEFQPEIVSVVSVVSVVSHRMNIGTSSRDAVSLH